MIESARQSPNHQFTNHHISRQSPNHQITKSQITSLDLIQEFCDAVYVQLGIGKVGVSVHLGALSVDYQQTAFLAGCRLVKLLGNLRRHATISRARDKENWPVPDRPYRIGTIQLSSVKPGPTADQEL